MVVHHRRLREPGWRRGHRDQRAWGRRDEHRDAGRGRVEVHRGGVDPDGRDPAARAAVLSIKRHYDRVERQHRLRARCDAARDRAHRRRARRPADPPGRPRGARVREERSTRTTCRRCTVAFDEEDADEMRDAVGRLRVRHPARRPRVAVPGAHPAGDRATSRRSTNGRSTTS